MDINNKKLLFIGPIGNPVKSFIDKFDFVIRSNNFFSIKKNILFSYRCDILVVNNIYTKLYHHIIDKNIHKIKYLIVPPKKLKFALKHINKKFHSKIFTLKFNKNKHDFKTKKHPLLVSRIIYFLIQNNYIPKEFFITGIDYYDSMDIDKIWLPGYRIFIKNVSNNKMLNINSVHDIDSNKKLLLFYLNKFNWINCDNLIYNIITKNNK